MEDEKKEEPKELTFEMLSKYYEEDKELNLHFFTLSSILAITTLLIDKGLCTSDDIQKLTKISRDTLIKREFDAMSDTEKQSILKRINFNESYKELGSLLGLTKIL